MSESISATSESFSSLNEFVIRFFFRSVGNSGDVSSLFLVVVTVGVAPSLLIIEQGFHNLTSFICAFLIICSIVCIFVGVTHSH